MLQKELHQINEKQAIDIEVKSITDGFLILYENGRAKSESFQISLTKDLMISLFKEFEQKSQEFIIKEELQITSVNFDFFRGNSLYFDVYFCNIVTKENFQARLYVFYKTNNHGNIGEIYSFHLVDNKIQ